MADASLMADMAVPSSTSSTPSKAAAVAHEAPRNAQSVQPLARRRYALEIRQHMPWRWQALILAAALLAGMAVSAAILIAAGVPADELANEFVMQTFFDGQNFRAVLFQAAPMILVGLAGCVAFRARFWNLGLEGQMIWGAIAPPPSRCGRSAPRTCACR